ncbi:hypothetical protein P389DRAFT_158963 [Cystobasidium minutum MCA 4210]|uniref:uncharacterized protein n=1 Tax=Cystobasidium minutum MCA 4210 TaxID=1397322 RepID=UPI0034CDF6B3|eukprot:jgi/Rhomi1/158963/estExt_Genewise1Plus.C_3_t10155
MKTFVCLERDDYRRLSDTFVSFRGNDQSESPKDLRVNVAEIPPSARDLAQYERPCTQQQLQSLGFDAFVIDLLEGPPDVLAYLCYAAQLHRVPVAFGDGRGVAHERLRQPNSPFRRYITHNTITDIQFSKYGNRGAIVQDQQTREPQLFAESIDQNRKRELDMKLAEAEAAKEEAQSQRNDLATRDVTLREQYEVIVEEKAQVDKERKRIESAKIEYERLGVSLRNAQAALESLQQQPSAEATRKQLADKIKKLSLKRVRTNRLLEGYSAALVKCHALEAQPTLAQLQSSASLQAVETTIATRTDEQAAIIRDYEAVSRRVNELRAVAKRIFGQAEEGQTRITERLHDAFQQRIDEIVNETADIVQQKVQDLRGELELSQHVNRGVIDRYEALKKSVEKLQKDILNEENGVRGSKEKIDRIHAKWQPRVKHIVDTVGQKFGAAMRSLGCLGEVTIKEDEDYAKWAISIQVAFRDGEALAELSSHRQSGGERSLTTMMYLISLLEMSKVPFSLVDEINQGMDPRAERAVHNHLVKAVCEAPDVGQYFLLTPKLLTNLYYHANIKVLCVNNGDWLPEEGLPIRQLIDKKLAAKRQAIRA